MNQDLKPHLIYLAFFFPPSRASGVYRAIATANVFKKSGWDVTVVTVEKKFFEEEIGTYDSSLFNDLETGIDVVRVPFTFNAGGYKKAIQKSGWFKANFPRLYQKVGRLVRTYLFGWFKANFPRLYQKVGRLVRTYLLDRKRPATRIDKYGAWIEPAVDVVERIHEEKPASHLLATANPFAAFEVAFQIQKKTNIDFSIDYRDPWTTDVYSGQKANHPKEIFQLERRIIDRASHVFHVNNAMAEVCRQQYPKSAGKHLVAPNGFDMKSVALPSLGDSGSPLVFVMLGTLNPHWPFNEIIEAWDRARQYLPFNSLLRLGGYLGYFAQSELPLRQLLPDESSGFEYVGPVSKSEVSNFYRSASVIIIPASGGPLVTTGKVYEAAAQPNPIVCVQSENGGARRALEGRPLVFSCEPSIDAIERAILDSAASSLRMGEADIKRIRNFAAPFERETSLKVIVESIGNKVLFSHG